MDFLIIGFVIFLIVRQMNRLRRPETPPAATKACPYCFSQIPLEATRCPACTSPLTAAEGAR